MHWLTGEFSVHYQPLVCPKDEEDSGRRSPGSLAQPNTGQCTHPIAFISLAEQNGTIYELGTFVLRSGDQASCRSGTDCWTGTNSALPSTCRRYSSVTSTWLIRSLTVTCNSTDWHPNLLELEITEGVLLQESYQTEQTIQELAARTGYSLFP